MLSPDPPVNFQLLDVKPTDTVVAWVPEETTPEEAESLLKVILRVLPDGAKLLLVRRGTVDLATLSEESMLGLGWVRAPRRPSHTQA